jgi:hypothetical protein
LACCAVVAKADQVSLRQPGKVPGYSLYFANPQGTKCGLRVFSFKPIKPQPIHERTPKPVGGPHRSPCLSGVLGRSVPSRSSTSFYLGLAGSSRSSGDLLHLSPDGIGGDNDAVGISGQWIKPAGAASAHQLFLG